MSGMNHRENVYCPACPEGKAFTIKGVELEIDSGFDGDSFKIRATRRMWEPLMLAHVECEMDDAHNRLYDQLTAIIEASGKTVEEMARAEVQATVDRLTQSARTMTQDRGNESVTLGEPSGLLSFAGMREAAEAQTMQPIRPVILPRAARP